MDIHPIGEYHIYVRSIFGLLDDLVANPTDFSNETVIRAFKETLALPTPKIVDDKKLQQKYREDIKSMLERNIGIGKQINETLIDKCDEGSKKFLSVVLAAIGLTQLMFKDSNMIVEFMKSYLDEMTQVPTVGDVRSYMDTLPERQPRSCSHVKETILSFKEPLPKLPPNRFRTVEFYEHQNRLKGGNDPFDESGRHERTPTDCYGLGSYPYYKNL